MDIEEIMTRVESGKSDANDAETLRRIFHDIHKALLDVVRRNCLVSGIQGTPDRLDSMYSPVYAKAIRLLADMGDVEITYDDGIHVVAEIRS